MRFSFRCNCSYNFVVAMLGCVRTSHFPLGSCLFFEVFPGYVWRLVCRPRCPCTVQESPWSTIPQWKVRTFFHQQWDTFDSLFSNCYTYLICFPCKISVTNNCFHQFAKLSKIFLAQKGRVVILFKQKGSSKVSKYSFHWSNLKVRGSLR